MDKALDGDSGRVAQLEARQSFRAAEHRADKHRNYGLEREVEGHAALLADVSRFLVPFQFGPELLDLERRSILQRIDAALGIYHGGVTGQVTPPEGTG
jgi:hypothetical protein